MTDGHGERDEVGRTSLESCDVENDVCRAKMQREGIAVAKERGREKGRRDEARREKGGGC